MTIEPQHLEEGLTGLVELGRRVPGLADELAESRSEFLGRSASLPGSEDERFALLRHLEWFVLERPSTALGGVPVEAMLHGSLDEDPRELFGEPTLAALVGSRCGVFQVTGVRAGEGVWLRDLLGFGEYPLQEVAGSHALVEGDLIVGRLFPVGAELYRMSSAAGMWRNTELVAALTADLERVRAQRRGVQRLSQSELESMFWGDVKRHREVTVQRARSILLGAGLAAADVEDIFANLAGTPFDPSHLLPGGGDVVGAILDQLAFETDLDLGEARSALIEIWPVLAAPADTPESAAVANPDSGSDTEVEVAQAIASFDEGRSAGRDLEELFRELEEQLQISDEEDPDDASDLAPDFPGVVGAMVEEFLWETATEHGAEVAAGHERLRELSRFGASIGVFEEFGPRELLSFAAVWLPEWGALASAQDAADMLTSLQAFCRWSEERHEHPLAKAYDERIVTLQASLPRVVEANRARTNAEPTAGDLFEYVSGERGAAQVQISVGGPRTVKVPPAITEHLEPGDRLRGSCDADGVLAVYCCYPAECAELTRPS